MANLSCAIGPGPHFKPTVSCRPFKGQQVEARLELQPHAPEELQIKHGSDKSEK